MVFHYLIFWWGGLCSNCFLYVSFIEPCYFLLCAGHFNYQFNISYFSDYKVQPPHQNWEENGGVSYSPNVAYLARWGGGSGGAGGFSYFSPLKPRCVLWSGVSYSCRICGKSNF